MARTLDEQIYQQQPQQRIQPPQIQTMNYNQGFTPPHHPNSRPLSALPPPQGSSWAPWNSNLPPTPPVPQQQQQQHQPPQFPQAQGYSPQLGAQAYAPPLQQYGSHPPSPQPLSD